MKMTPRPLTLATIALALAAWSLSIATTRSQGRAPTGLAVEYVSGMETVGGEALIFQHRPDFTADALDSAGIPYRAETSSLVYSTREIRDLLVVLSDPDIQRASARIAQSVIPDDLAPRPKGRHLAMPCGRRSSKEPFDGKLSGTVTGGRTPLDVDVVLSRQGDKVTGSYSFGVGFARLDGSVQGPTLKYRWSLAPENGEGQLTLQGDEYRGTWGSGSSSDSWRFPSWRAPGP
jgi:hypothetical protein